MIQDTRPCPKVRMGRCGRESVSTGAYRVDSEYSQNPQPPPKRLATADIIPPRLYANRARYRLYQHHRWWKVRLLSFRFLSPGMDETEQSASCAPGLPGDLIRKFTNLLIVLKSAL